MAIQKTKAIVLRTTKLRETSLIITFHTEDFGKIQAVAKGVRKEHHPSISHFEIFSLLDIVFYEKTMSDVHLLSESSLIDFFPKLRGRLDRLAWASYLIELTDCALPVHEKNEGIFHLLLECLKAMQQVPPEMVVHIYEVQLFQAAGFLPQLGECLRCQRKDQIGQSFVSIEQGGTLCRGCAANEKRLLRLSQGAIKTLRFFSENDLRKSLHIKIDRRTESELRRLFFQMAPWRFEKPLKTISFLRSVVPSLS